MHDSLAFVLKHGYAVLFAFVFAEQVGLPIPAVPMLLAMGALIGTGEFHLGAALATVVAASLVGDLPWYWLGKRRGSSVLSLLCKISLEPDSCIRRTENLFIRWGEKILIVAKFVPGLGTAAPPLAGMFHMSGMRFALYDGTGALLWGIGYGLIGWVFRNQLEMLADQLMSTGSRLGIGVAVIVGSYIGWKYFQRQRLLRELRMSRIMPDELKEMLDSGTPVTIVDLRNILEWEDSASKIPGALHIAYEDFEERQSDLPTQHEVILYCSCPNEVSSASAALKLKKRGITRVRPLVGGFEEWRTLGYPLEAVHVPLRTVQITMK